ncbi:hypothetical protein PoB_002992400 [Plakobranchus ocellatus]|uniref:Uncharacterized protein n=1 Tax=Plakobranchus ocellatus TaxID=259542 RepID=A0AAV4AB05_9GAST|nr:hypothetical protein PoB_002992400 [Plakobranchus ocellatus]
MILVRRTCRIRILKCPNKQMSKSSVPTQPWSCSTVRDLYSDNSPKHVHMLSTYTRRLRQHCRSPDQTIALGQRHSLWWDLTLRRSVYDSKEYLRTEFAFLVTYLAKGRQFQR